ncbi:hypothetical protein OF829_09325 [Sphingomonas sp. LB-2]|uniref:hypothetical protein n=1 Tax=Sphingomonas caeni TaxID=2984949 RepID=UPI0022323860|nr:hypothetical protein [Sphingomonas caeni]MCW3847443.1 hypothetical protein [Sphingomonas caeni]
MKLPPLAIGLGGGLLLALLLAPATGTALGTLASARAERAKLAEALAAPESNAALVAPDAAVPGGDAVIARIRERARGGGVLVEDARPLRGEGALVTVRFRISGAEKAVVALADSLEREAPLVRLRTWKLEAIPGGVRLSADAVAVLR